MAETISLKLTCEGKVCEMAVKLRNLTVVTCQQASKSLLIVILFSYKAYLADVLSEYIVLVEIEFYFFI